MNQRQASAYERYKEAAAAVEDADLLVRTARQHGWTDIEQRALAKVSQSAALLASAASALADSVPSGEYQTPHPPSDGETVPNRRPGS